MKEAPANFGTVSAIFNETAVAAAPVASQPSFSFNTSLLAGDHEPAVQRKVTEAKRLLRAAQSAFDDARSAVESSTAERIFEEWQALQPEGRAVQEELAAAKNKVSKVNDGAGVFDLDQLNRVQDAKATLNKASLAVDRFKARESIVVEKYKAATGRHPETHDEYVASKRSKRKNAKASKQHRVISSRRVLLYRAEMPSGHAIPNGTDLVLLVPGIETDVEPWVLENRHFRLLQSAGLASAI